MIRPLILAFGVVGSLNVGAAAAPFCDGAFDRSHVEFGFFFGDDYSEDDRNTYDLMHLRQRGVDATRVERWNGCIRAFVRVPGGGEAMQFFEPGTYREVF